MINSIPALSTVEKYPINKGNFSFLSCTGTLRPVADCGADLECPPQCRCTDGIIDCVERGLKKIPDLLPEGATELWVNMILYN